MLLWRGFLELSPYGSDRIADTASIQPSSPNHKDREFIGLLGLARGLLLLLLDRQPAIRRLPKLEVGLGKHKAFQDAQRHH